MNYLEFKQIPGFSSYRINRLGQVWSDKSNKALKAVDTHYGYLAVSLTNDEGKQKVIRVHQLLAMVFLGHKRDGHNIVVDHINGNKLDNRLENLKLVTNRENLSKDKYKIKASKLPLGISYNRNGYLFKKWLGDRYYQWYLSDLEQAVEMKELFEYLVDTDGLEYAIKTLDANRTGRGFKSQAELNGDLIKLQ